MTSCSVDDCARPHLARTFCAKHYKRWQVHGSPHVSAHREYCDCPDGTSHKTKVCSDCGEEKPRQDFWSSGKTHDLLNTYCKLCDNRRRVSNKHSLSREQFDELRQSTCAICDGPGEVVDHDHACCPSNNSSCGRCVRGFLCRKCNVGLGMFLDDPEKLERAKDYILRQNNPAP